MESLLSDTHTSSNLSSREQSLDQAELLQVPVLHPPDCNGTTYHLSDHCYDEALSSHYQTDQEEEEFEEVCFCFLYVVEVGCVAVTQKGPVSVVPKS